MPHHPHMDEAEDGTLSVLYRFELEGGTTYEYRVIVNSKTLESTCDVSDPPPRWTRLGSHCRQICHYQGGEHCPAALRLVAPVSMFSDVLSYERTKVTVVTEEREYAKETDIQDGLRSLFGLLLATSGCPTLKEFKPMARFHLPFSSLEETSFRIAATTLLKRYFEFRDGQIAHIDREALTNLRPIYEAVADVNKGLAQQVTEAFQHESSANAMTILDAFSILVPESIGADLEGLRTLLFGE